jgi:hypothetical protein
LKINDGLLKIPYARLSTFRCAGNSPPQKGEEEEKINLHCITHCPGEPTGVLHFESITQSFLPGPLVGEVKLLTPISPQDLR